MIDLAKCIRDRPKHRRYPLGHLVAQFVQTLRDHLALEVEVAPIFKYQGDERQSRLVERPHVRHSWKPSHRNFNGNRDETLNLFRRFPRCFRCDLHLYVRDIRKCVDGKLLCCVDAEAAENGCNYNKNQTMFQR